MKVYQAFFTASSLGCLALLLSACASSGGGSTRASNDATYRAAPRPSSSSFASRMPSHISPIGEKVVIVNPRVHAWGAYSPDGSLVKGGMASAGANWCPDLGRSCHTKTGTFRINSLGAGSCKSHIFPLPHGGAPMPYCMFFNGGQALHGAPAHEVVDGNVSHGCVRLQVSDAEWLRFNFVNVGTKVVIDSY